MSRHYLVIQTAVVLLLVSLVGGFLFGANWPISPVFAAPIDPPQVTPTPPETPSPPLTPTETPTSSPNLPPPTAPPPSTPTPTETLPPLPPPTETLTPTPLPTETPTQAPTPPATSTETATVTTSLETAAATTVPETATATTLLETVIPLETATPTAPSIPGSTSLAPAAVTVLVAPGDVVINEVVTDPQQDWSTAHFIGVVGVGPVTDADEFVELYIKTSGLDLTGWTIELLDTTPVTGTLSSYGAFQTARYVGTGTFTNTLAGDYVVLGDVRGAGAMNNSILIVLRDNNGLIIDKVELGNDLEGDGAGDGAPDGTANGGNATNVADEAIFRYPNGTDTADDVADFVAGEATMGSSNDAPTLPAAPLLIGEFLYDGLTSSTEGDEFVELCNPMTATLSLADYKVGDEEAKGGGESMYQLPITATLEANTCRVVAKNAAQFQTRFGVLPDFEVIITGNNYIDHPAVPNLSKYTAWGRGDWALANDGDELVVLGPGDQIVDSVAYCNGDYTTLGLEPDASAPQPASLQRVWPVDTNSMPHDFVRTDPNPGSPTWPPPPPAAPPAPAALPDGMYAFWGDLHAHTTYSDGAGPPYYALSMARAAGLHFYAITDHDWQLSRFEWDNSFTQTHQASLPGVFVALRGVEWTLDGAGHINVFNTNTLLNSHIDPLVDTLPEFYVWLAANPTVIAQFNHPAATAGGDFDSFAYQPAAAPMMFMQEIGNRAQGYQTYEPAFVQSNILGWRVAPTNNSDVHTAHWGSDSPARTGIVAPALTEADLFEAMRARRVFATEDSNLAVALQVNGAWMGSSLTTTGPLSLIVDMVDPDPEPLTLFLHDGNLPLATVPLATSTGRWATIINALPGHFFWVKVVQADGNTAYTAPVWIEGKAPPDTLFINEILPAPHDWDWDGDGTPTYQDEWVELFNPTNRPIGLGGWQLVDSSGFAYNLPLGGSIQPGAYATFYYAQTKISLNNGGDTLTLIHPNGTTIDSFSYDHTPGYDESWCRLPDGGASWSDDCGPSPMEANWEKASAGPLAVNIFEAKRLTYDAWVRVKGRVTAPPGVLGSRNMYIQDDTAGILIYLPKDHRLYFNLGDKVTVVGNVRTFHEEFEIVVDGRSDVKFSEPGLPPSPLPIATTSLLEPYEGRLVMLQGQVVRFQGYTTFWLNDGTDPAKIYLRQSTGIKKPYFDRGTPVTAVGIVSQYSEEDDSSRHDYRLLLRYPTDLTGATPAASPTHWPLHLPETGH